MGKDSQLCRHARVPQGLPAVESGHPARHRLALRGIGSRPDSRLRGNDGFSIRRLRSDQTRTHARAAIVFALTLVLSACGFRLAGSRPLPEPLQTVSIDVIKPYKVSESPLETALRASLLRRGAQIVDKNQAAAVTQILLSELNEARDTLSIGLDGKAQEFRLVTSVRYQVQRGTQVLVPPDTLYATRDYSFEPQQVLAKEAEEARLREFIQTELAELLLLRLEAQLSRAVPKAPVAAPVAAPDAIPAP